MKKFGEESDEWLIGNNDNDKYTLGDSWEAIDFQKVKYGKLAEKMKNCIEIIKGRYSDKVRRNAALDLRRCLEDCLADGNLRDLTAIYKDLKENNAIGYNPPAVARFVTKLCGRYPKH